MAESGVPPNGSEAWCWRPSRSTRRRARSASPTRHVPDPIQAALPGGGVGAVAGNEVDQDVPGRASLGEGERCQSAESR